ncbi:hypothetical protein H6P81_015042 [Aristolochia fimbriata]|uniref:Uncharacterized protein n=1 Tax=Aristolochia fimbriata TaxID=158543 RepID=A0AAV7E7F9_ARIFI|nr:hypothetical protein H6P81_015042 [Aristolochia fimbriata]
MRTSSAGSSSQRSSYHRGSENFDSADLDSGEYGLGGPMLPFFLNDLRRDFVEVTLEIDDDAIVVCGVAPSSEEQPPRGSNAGNGFFSRSSSVTSRIRRKFPWLRSSSSRSMGSSTAAAAAAAEEPTISARDARKMQARLDRTRSSAQRALRGLRFISRRTDAAGDANELWKTVESRFDSLATDGLLSRDDFAECIGMVDSKEFAVGIFDALARRKHQKIERITKEEFYDFWLQMSDQSFDARLQIFFDMVDSNVDGKITREEVQELITLSASANNLSKLKEQAEEYAALIMEELDPENFGYIELWQLEALLLQRDNYMNYSRPLSTTSAARSQTVSLKPHSVVRRISSTVRWRIQENWQRAWIVLLWCLLMVALFAWKFVQYRRRAVFHVMGYCVTTAKGAAETLKLNMALVLLPVCRNTLTWLRSTRARLLVPFDDNINFHKMIAFGILIGIVLHAGNHIACDFPRLISSSPTAYRFVSSDFGEEKPSYAGLLTGVEGLTGVAMVVLMGVAFTLATRRFRKNGVKLPPPLNRLTGFNAFWYSHHLFALVYVLLIVHGYCLFLVHKWYLKTTWMYISAPLLLYLGERTLRAFRSGYYSVKIIKVAVLPGNVLSLIMSKPHGFRYKSGQYIFLQCPKISPFEWHPFSITSAPGEDHLSVHIRTNGDWTQELKRVFTETGNAPTVIGRAKFGARGRIEQKGLPRLLVDGPYGAPAQDYANYDVLLLVGLGIGATPFISILKDLLSSIRLAEDQTDSNTDTSRSDDSLNSFGSTATSSNGKKKSQRTTHAHFYWVTREPGSFEWFKGVMNEVAEMDQKGIIEMHNYLTSVYEEGDARSTLLTMVQALNHAKHGVDIVSGTRVRTHFARPNWKEVFSNIATKHPYSTVGVFYCGYPGLAKELKRLSQEMGQRTSTRFEFHKEYF